MKYVLVRTFNPLIVSKTGALHKRGNERPSEQWIKFENLLLRCLHQLDYNAVLQPENINVPSIQADFISRIMVHSTKRSHPEFDFFYMQMHLPELFTFDAYGWGAEHSELRQPIDLSYVSQFLANRFVSQKVQYFLTSGNSKHEQPKPGRTWDRIKEKLKQSASSYVLIPLQIPRDYVINEHSPISVAQFIDTVAAWAEKNQRPVAFKLHPHNKKDKDIKSLVALHTRSSRFVSTITGNIHSLISKAEAVWTINSGVGFEALFHGKPVITMGNCDYKYLTCNTPNTDSSEIQDYIASYGKQKINAANRFLYHYYNQIAYSTSEDHIENSEKRLLEYLKKHL